MSGGRCVHDPDCVNIQCRVSSVQHVFLLTDAHAVNNRSLARAAKADATATSAIRSTWAAAYLVGSPCFSSYLPPPPHLPCVHPIVLPLSALALSPLCTDTAPFAADLCAGVSCVDHATCSPASGRCECQLPYAGHGPVCVQGECLGVTCRQHSFCQRGLCYCRVGYHPDGDACMAGRLTGKAWLWKPICEKLAFLFCSDGLVCNT